MLGAIKPIMAQPTNKVSFGSRNSEVKEREFDEAAAEREIAERQKELKKARQQGQKKGFVTGAISLGVIAGLGYLVGTKGGAKIAQQEKVQDFAEKINNFSIDKLQKFTSSCNKSENGIVQEVGKLADKALEKLQGVDKAKAAEILTGTVGATAALGEGLTDGKDKDGVATAFDKQDDNIFGKVGGQIVGAVKTFSDVIG